MKDLPPPNGDEIIQEKESSYVKRKVEKSENLSGVLREVSNLNFVGTFIGDLKHYNEREKNPFNIDD